MKIRYLAALLCACGVSAAATADTIQLAYNYVEAGGTLSGVLNGNDFTNFSNADGVQFMSTANPVGPVAALIPTGVWAVCRELGQNTDFPFNTYNVDYLSNSPIGQPKADLIAQLWGQHYDHSWESNTAIYVQGFLNGEPANTPENQNALAFIYAVYAIRYNFDGTAASLTVTNPTLPYYQYVDSNPGTIAITNSWLAGLDLNYSGSLPTLLDLTSDTLQDLIIEVPTPSVAAMFGVAGLAMVRRRR